MRTTESQADPPPCFVRPEPLTPIWLICHERLRQAPALRALLDAVIARTATVREALRGRI